MSNVGWARALCPRVTLFLCGKNMNPSHKVPRVDTNSRAHSTGLSLVEIHSLMQPGQEKA